MYAAVVTSIVAFCLQLQLALAVPALEPRQDITSFPRPFFLVTRNQDVSNGTADFNNLSLVQALDHAGNPLLKAFATSQGSETLFSLHNGVLSTEFTYINAAGETETSKWKNTILYGNRRVEWKPVSDLDHPRKARQMNVEIGTHAFLSPGGKYTESDWTFCRHEDGSDYGFAIGDVGKRGVTCEAVYAFVTPPDS